jgi:hypothetical protein
MKEIFVDPNTNATTQRRIFAFGTHVDALTKDYPALGPNAEITAVANAQAIRVIMDELLVGNALEEIACRAPIDGVNAYDRVPLGTTPDDIAKCASAKDVLPAACPGTMTHAVCICQADAGCGPDIAKGQPVGVLDVNQDGAADDTRMIAGATGIKCGAIDVPMDLNASYWNPSGDQNKPAMGGFDALGPALVLAPAGALPTSTECELAFAPDVVDKQGNQVCVPANGDVNAGCNPGDMAAFKFKVEALRMTPGFANNGTGVSTTNPLTIVANAPIGTGTLTAVTMATMAGTNVPITVTLAQPTSIRIDFVTPLTPMTTYVITIATTLADTYGQKLPQTVTYTFTTGA